MQELGEVLAGKEVEADDIHEPDDPDVLDEEIEELDGADEVETIAWQKQTQQTSASAQNDPTEREDLARFREEWKAEVMRQRHGAQILVTPNVGTKESSKPDAKVVEPSIHQPSHSLPASSRPNYVGIASSSIATSKDPASLPLPSKLSKALDIYHEAVLHEQRSELDEALRLYRQAFRLDENVGKVYGRIEYHARVRTEGPLKPPPSQEAGGRVLGHAKQKSDHGGITEVAHGLDKLSLGKSSTPAPFGVATGTLAHLVAQWPSVLTFEPEEETEPVHIRVLPEELLVYILHFLDVTALGRFALVNRKACILSLDSTIWKERVEAIYIAPQIADDEDIDSLLSQHMQDYRRLYIEHPRVRLDGVYIAVCHYIRDGLSEHAWVNVSHLITYHRYLRFFPNGEVLSLLTNEEVPPQTVIPLLYPTLRMKGFFIGQWRLEGSTVYITNLMDPSGTTFRYAFQMILDLRSRPLGRWNRLDFRTYDSVSLESGEATPLALKNDRPYWFSKVRSYA
ncbi:hypothetical protein BC835DRAFT_1410103 [Cytidiella melzeri]|nr:hypothetical protein BC835DRAFT_1410103 [Cytidiella melzeri]